MDFLIAFLWYLLAFALGAAVAWILAAVIVKPRSVDAAFAPLETPHPTGETA